MNPPLRTPSKNFNHGWVGEGHFPHSKCVEFNTEIPGDSSVARGVPLYVAEAVGARGVTSSMYICLHDTIG
jgi:hypothetical protein